MNLNKPIFLNRIVDEKLLDFVTRELKIAANAARILEPHSGYEEGFADSFNFYCPPCLEVLSEIIQPVIENKLQLKLYPSYTYARLYRHGSRLNKHYDRRSSEFTVSLSLEYDDSNWPLCILDDENNINKFVLNKGEAVIYSGRQFAHWRDGPYKGKEQAQAFFQYVDINGDSADLKYDGKIAPGLPFTF